MAEEERRYDHGYSFGKSRLDRLREELNEFAGPQYETLYRRWREQGDCVLGENPQSGQGLRRLCELSIGSRLRAVRRVRQEDTGMREMRNIVDCGGKHRDPMNGPPGDRVHRLEEVGRTL